MMHMLTWLTLGFACAVCQGGDRWADAVVEWELGPGGGFGSQQLPDNLLGPPDSTATPTSPSSSPEQLFTPGDGGYVVLAFLDNRVLDGPGPDLRICENPFLVGGNPDQVWSEPAIIELSEDGLVWITVPWDSLSGEGLAGRVPVNGSGDPDDPADMGGDLVDLAALGLLEVGFVRLRDLPGDGRTFDLDAVGGLRNEGQTPVRAPRTRPRELAIWPNPGRGVFTLDSPGRGGLALYTIAGRRLQLPAVGAPGPGTFSLPELPNGIYLLEWVPEVGPPRRTRLILTR